MMQYSDEKETAVCNLASIGLPSFVNVATKEFDYDKLHSVVKVITLNLNRIIDLNYYPTNKTKISKSKFALSKSNIVDGLKMNKKNKKIMTRHHKIWSY